MAAGVAEPCRGNGQRLSARHADGSDRGPCKQLRGHRTTTVTAKRTSTSPLAVVAGDRVVPIVSRMCPGVRRAGVVSGAELHQ